MKRFIEGEDRTQVTLLPACLEDYVEAENPVRVVEVFVEGLDLGELGFEGVDPAVTGRPAYHPAVLLKLYIYGYLNRIQSSRRLEREAQRNVELMWLTGRLMPDFKTIANFRKDNGRAIRKVCRQFIVLCRQLNLFTEAIVAIDGSKFKAVNNRDKNFTAAKMQRRMAQIEESIARYLAAMDTADRAEPEMAELKKGHLQDKITALKEQMQRLKMLEAQMLERPDQQLSLTDPDARSMKSRDGGIVGYNVQTAVDAKHHLIVAHEVVTAGIDRDQLTPMAEQARAGHWHRRSNRGGRPRLLQRRTDTRLRPSRDHPHRTQDANLEQPGRRPLRQAGLHLHRPRRRISLSCRTAGDQTLYHGRSWDDARCLLELGLSALPDQNALHHQPIPTNPTLEARGCSRSDAAATGSATRDDASAATNGRACVRNDQVLDGLDTFPDQDAGARAHRDEPACARL
jgi:transposase